MHPDRRHHRVSFLLILIIPFSTLLPAQDSLEELSLEELLNIPVVTATRQLQQASEVPATVYVITAEQIRQRGYENLEDLLQDVPEVEIQKKANHETWNHISIRGVSGNEKFVVLLDGVRISSPTGDHHLVGANFSLAAARRVEVILGPASALYGVDAFSGIIHIITKSAEEAKGLELTGSYGRFDTTSNWFVLGQKISNVNFTATGSLFHTDEPFFPKYFPNEYDWFTTRYRTSGLVRLSPFAPPDQVLQLPIRPYNTPTNSGFLHARVEAGDFEFAYVRSSESHSTSVSVRPEFTIYSEDAVWGSILSTISGKHTLNFPDDRWKLQSTLYHSAHSLDTDSKFVNTFSGYNDAFKYGYGKTFKLEEQVSFTPEEWSIIFGFSFEDLSALPKTSDLPFAYNTDLAADVQGLYYLGTNVRDRNGRDLTIAQDFFNVEYKNLGTYFQLQTRASDRLSITLGSRYDYNTRYGSSFNPRIGLVLSPTGTWKAKLLYGESFLAPSPYKAYEHFGAFFPATDESGKIVGLNSLFWRLPNPNLQPEKLRSVEGALACYLSPRVALSFDAYYNRINDTIVEQDTPDGEFKGVLVADVQTLVNRGTLSAGGGTIRVDSIWSRGDTTMNLHGSYSLSDGNENGEVLPFSAMHTVKIGADVTFRQWSFSPRLIYRSRTFHPRKDDFGNNISNEPFTVLDLFVRYSGLFGKSRIHDSIFVRLNNVTDRRYFHVRLGGAPASEFLATPQDPFRFLVGFTIHAGF